MVYTKAVPGPRVLADDMILIIILTLMSTEFHTPVVYFCALLFLWPSGRKEINNGAARKFEA